MNTGTKGSAANPSAPPSKENLLEDLTRLVWSRDVFWVLAVYAGVLLVMSAGLLLGPHTTMPPSGRSRMEGFALYASMLQIFVLTVFGTAQGVRAAKPRPNGRTPLSNAQTSRPRNVVSRFFAAVYNVLLLPSVSFPFFFLTAQLGMIATESLPVLLLTHALSGIACASVGFAFAAWFPHGNVDVRATTLSFLWLLVPPVLYYLVLGGYAPNHPIRDVVLYASPGTSVFLFKTGPISAVCVHVIAMLAVAVSMTGLAIWRLRRAEARP